MHIICECSLDPPLLLTKSLLIPVSSLISRALQWTKAKKKKCWLLHQPSHWKQKTPSDVAYS